MKQSLLLSIALAICCSCSKPVPAVDGVDFNVWKSDYKGCLDTRKQFIDTLGAQKNKLKGLSEKDLISLLGRPDRNDLSERHEKFYYYFITPGPGCNGYDSLGLSLIVRFNATGVSKEVVLQ